ncbi:protease Do-like 7 [Triticum aestivum]|uniref:protease Do-like 7 n=1 Tax=Triticum aestivum TaxID=4565 RepID=UPI001D015050|nr:protease Do-like 7 [Triticum aestivum]
MLSRALVPPYSIIKKFARKDIADLGDFIAVISELSRGERVPLEYVTYTARHRNKCTIVTIDQHGWYATPQLYTRNDATGLWIAKSAMLLESPYVVSIHQRGHRDVNSNVDENIAVEGTVSSSRDLDDIKGVSRHSSSMEGSDLARTISGNTSLAEQVIKPALVKFEVHVPPICMIDGVHAKHFTGAGVVIHHSDSLGLIAVDRNTVAISISDIMVSFAAYPIEIPGQVIFLHPFHYFALVAYDPLTLGVGASVIRASKLLTEPALRRGDSVYLVRLIDSLHAKSRKSIVTNWQAINICSSDFPRYHAMNTEVIELDTDSDIELSGVLTDEQGRVQALWASISSQLFGCGKEGDHQFVVGIPIHLISQVLEKIISGAPGPFRLINGIRRPMPFVRLLEVEIYPTLLTEASNYGLSDRWVQALAEKDPERRQVLQIIGCFAGSKAETLCEGDMILAIDKKPITCFLDIENACQKLDHSVGSDGMLNMTIFRQGHSNQLKSTAVNMVSPWSNLVKGGLGAKPWSKEVKAIQAFKHTKHRAAFPRPAIPRADSQKATQPQKPPPRKIRDS